MKREIMHIKCVPAPRGIHKDMSAIDAAMAALESSRRVQGKLKGSCLCDFCNEPINKGDVAVAISSSGMGEYLYKWEDDYLESEVK